MSTAMKLGVSLGSALAGPAIDLAGHRGGFAFTLIFAWLMVIAALLGIKTLRRVLQQKPVPLPEFEAVQPSHEAAPSSPRPAQPSHETAQH